MIIRSTVEEAGIVDRGLKTLFAIYKDCPWEAKISEAEIALAQEEGYLFDYPKYESHSDTVNRLFCTLEKIDPKDVANAFLFSLSTRRLEYRSALGSYYYAKAIPVHELMNSYNKEMAARANRCYLCGWHAWKTNPNRFDMATGLNIWNYWRYKYGGDPVGRLEIQYALFDLEQFAKLPTVIPTEDDVRILKMILSCVSLLKSSDKAGKLRDAIIKMKPFKCNKDEVSVLLGELGTCGILASKEYPSYDEYFANEYERDSDEFRSYFAYPVNRWHARDGINAEKMKEVFRDTILT